MRIVLICSPSRGGNGSIYVSHLTFLMFTKFLDFLDKRLKSTSLDLILGAGIVIYLVFKLSDWGMKYADTALAKGADLTGTAAVIAAVAGIPVALLTLVFNTYVKSWGNSDSTN